MPIQGMPAPLALGHNKTDFITIGERYTRFDASLRLSIYYVYCKRYSERLQQYHLVHPNQMA